MSSIYEMIKKLEDNKVSFCYQAQHTSTPFYNLRIRDMNDLEVTFNYETVEEIVGGLKFHRPDIFAPVVRKMPMPSPM